MEYLKKAESLLIEMTIEQKFDKETIQKYIEAKTMHEIYTAPVQSLEYQRGYLFGIQAVLTEMHEIYKKNLT